MESKTQRTDDREFAAIDLKPSSRVVYASFARQLETELAESEKKAFVYKTALEQSESELIDARAEIEKIKAPTSIENLDERMKAAGMLTVSELLAGTPLDRFSAHVGVNTLKRFEEWLLMRRSEILKMQATMILEKKESDGLYEWILAHSGALAEVIANFRQVKPEIERKNKLIEQMREALKFSLIADEIRQSRNVSASDINDACETSRIKRIAALSAAKLYAAERGE